MITGALEQRIHILPESVINQIAAGEVVLRPASVIKELGENAIDAEAFSISIWTEQGGKKRIQVTDDGIGMSPIDAELCFERHATSKISSAKDLSRLLTKGFRGEALASIAAVAEVELFTRRPQDKIGTHVQIAFGKKLLVEPTRCAPGTTLIVQKLFHKLPVRRKSLRSDATEHRHNLQEFFRLAYPHPERLFRFYHNDTLLYDLPPTSPLNRILALHPELRTEDLVSVEDTTPFFSAQGFLVLPEATPPQNREGFLFINRRYIRHAGLQQSIYQVYKPLLREEQRPLYWLFLEIDPAQIDINITPSKTEVCLLHEMEVRAMLQSIVRRILAVARLALPTDWIEKSTAKLPPPPSAPPPPSQPNSSTILPLPNPTGRELPDYLLLFGRFLVLRRAGEVWLLDLFGAHQRILYERYVQGIPVSPQGLLFPVHASVTPIQAAHLTELIPALERAGLRIEIREGREAVLHSVPAGLSPAAALPVLQEILRLAEALPPDWRERIAQHMARHSVARPPYPLSPEAVEALWQDLQRCAQPEYSPTGRRIRFLLTEEALERLFQ
ncbi:MAG: DNA mismatch repair endonuclease MutL [Bacteroidia bacterium]|nr:DNA mismatch repair endonuclease MutL [Bacteroidia bacterium]